MTGQTLQRTYPDQHGRLFDLDPSQPPVARTNSYELTQPRRYALRSPGGLHPAPLSLKTFQLSLRGMS